MICMCYKTQKIQANNLKEESKKKFILVQAFYLFYIVHNFFQYFSDTRLGLLIQFDKFSCKYIFLINRSFSI